MVVADDAKAIENNGAMARQDANATTVIVLDESCQERHFDKKHSSNGITSPHITDKIEGILSKDDVQMLLTIFDTGSLSLERELLTAVITTPSPTNCLAVLTPKESSFVPPPTLFLVPLSPSSMTPTHTPVIGQTTPQIESDAESRSPRSSTSHKKHAQSNASEKLSYGPEFLQVLQQSSYGMAHIVPVALCRKGEQWSKDDLVRLLDYGIHDILTIPCEIANVGGLLMVFQLWI
jgi:hypothetical protein